MFRWPKLRPPGKFVSVRSIADLVCEQAGRSPGALAVIDSARQLTYAELNAQANQLARHLRTKAVGCGDRVALMMEPSCDLALVWLAVWRLGAVAVPLDPAAPPRRLARTIAASECRHAITSSEYADLMRPLTECVVHVDAERPWIATQDAGRPSLKVPPALGCIFYTSGSTGEPKGVALSLGALSEKFSRPGAWGAIDEGCRAVWHSSAAFDASLAQLFLPLVHGGCVRALNHVERLDARRLWRVLSQHGVTVIDATPSWLAAMLVRPPALPTLRRIVLGGETFAPGLARRLRQIFPQAQLVNVYGPTEACIDATAHELHGDDLSGPSIPIGRPLEGYRVLLLDPEGHAVKPTEVGEIYIGGFGLAEGYWGRPDLTEASFIPDPRNAHAKLYRTGDMGRRDTKGRLYFLGRRDQQIKLRGQRIEPQEIEIALSGQPGVAAAAVKVWPLGAGGEPVLVGYVVLKAGTTLKAVRAALAQELPATHAPTLLVPLAAMPLTLTGKIDRHALPKPIEEFGAPRALPEAGPVMQIANADPQAVEAMVLQIWRETLGLAGLGRNDNFFEVGGDSLVAVTLGLGMSERFGVDFPATLVMEFPTVADAAIALTRGRHMGCGSRVLELNTRGDGPPLFLLPPGTGVGIVYAGLVRELADMQPCFALQAVRFPERPGTIGMEELAAYFVHDLNRLHPRGPIHLCGYSAGGAVAHEMTIQLARQGREVERLVLLDPYCADASDCPDGISPEDRTAGFWSSCREMIGDAFGLRGQAAEPLLSMAQQLWATGLIGRPLTPDSTVMRPLLRRLGDLLPANADADLFLLLLEGVANICHAYFGHTITPLPHYRGSAVMIQPDADPSDFRLARHAFWTKIIGPQLESFLAPGDHPTMLQRACSLTAIGDILKSQSCFPGVRHAHA